MISEALRVVLPSLRASKVRWSGDCYSDGENLGLGLGEIYART